MSITVTSALAIKENFTIKSQNSVAMVQTEKAMASHSSSLAWKIPWMEEPGRLQSMGSIRVVNNWTTSLSHIGEGNGNPLQCSCLENESQGQQSCVWLFVIPWTAACQASLSITNSRSLHILMSIQLVKPSNHLILCWPLLLLPSIFPSIRVFSSELVFPIRWTKYWTFSFSISPSNECSGLISFRIDWFDLLAVQGTLRSLLQHHSSKHQFFSAQPSL